MFHETYPRGLLSIDARSRPLERHNLAQAKRGQSMVDLPRRRDGYGRVLSHVDGLIITTAFCHPVIVALDFRVIPGDGQDEDRHEGTPSSAEMMDMLCRTARESQSVHLHRDSLWRSIHFCRRLWGGPSSRREVETTTQ